jgi:protein-disulfide isomerase
VAFWALVDSIYRDQGRLDDPHLWERARALDLDLERFEHDRRSEALVERVRRDFESGIRAGVIGTPAAFVDGRPITGDLASQLAL